MEGNYQLLNRATNLKKSTKKVFFDLGPVRGGKQQYMNLREITELKVKIQNLKDLLNSTIRYGEDDLSRIIREKIQKKERELTILQTKLNAISYDETGTSTP
jgi:hypothetical protein